MKEQANGLCIGPDFTRRLQERDPTCGVMESLALAKPTLQHLYTITYAVTRTLRP